MGGLGDGAITAEMIQAAERIGDAIIYKAAPRISKIHHEFPHEIRNHLERVRHEDEQLAREIERTGHEPSEPPHGGTSAHSRAEFLSHFPEYPVDRVFSDPEGIARSYSLDHRGTETVIEAYEIARKHIAPFNTWISDSILHDLRLEALEDPHRKFAFLGRDGHIIAAGVRGRDPEFFKERCVEIVVSRPVMELVARDYEQVMGIRLSLASDFRVNLEAHPNPDLWRERTPGSFENFVSYINRKRLGDGPFTVVDNGLRGSAQEIMTHVLGKEINGHYAFLSISPNDLNPGTKKGHVFHLPGERMARRKRPYSARRPGTYFLTHEVSLGCRIACTRPCAISGSNLATRAGPNTTGPPAESYKISGTHRWNIPGARCGKILGAWRGRSK